jgi:aryl carrier-like protein
VPALVTQPAVPMTRGGEDERAKVPQIEADMVRIWAELLDLTEPFGVHDNLFRLGAGSLAVVRFAARIAEAYGVELGVDRIIAAPTVAGLAATVSAELGAARDAEAPDRAGLAELSDGELDELLRRLQAARDRRRATRDDR